MDIVELCYWVHNGVVVLVRAVSIGIYITVPNVVGMSEVVWCMFRRRSRKYKNDVETENDVE